MRISLTAVSGGRTADVLVDSEPDATVGALSDQLAGCLGIPATTLFLGGSELPADTPVAEAALLDGSVVGVGGPVETPAVATSRGWQLHVVAGPDAGTILALPVGDHELGRSAAVTFTDPMMSRRHALLTVTGEGATVTDLESRNGTWLDGQRLPQHEATPLEPGAMLGIGDSIMTIRVARTGDAATEAAEPGWLSFLRPPRMLPYEQPVTIRIPEAPTEPHKRRFPLATILAPLALGIVMAVARQSPGYLLFSVASPMMMLTNMLADRKSGAKDYKKAVADYTVALATAQQRLSDAVLEEQSRRRVQLPDAADTILTAGLPGRRLWERRRIDRDALVLRVGVADLPTTVRIERSRRADDLPDGAPLLHAVPVPLPLQEAGVVGVCGPEETVQGILRWLVLQLAAYHAPRDLAFTLLTSRTSEHWSWIKWLPHIRSRELESYFAAIGNDPETVAARVADLSALLKARQDIAKQSRLDGDHFPAHVLVVDGARALRATPGLASILQDGPAVGIYAICADVEERLLPETCTATLSVSPQDAAHVELKRSGLAPLPEILVESVTPAWALSVARSMAPLRDVAAEEDEVVLPDSSRLLDVLSLEPPTADAIRARWQLEGRTTTMTLGVGLDGPFALDLRRDGPHALIAGTTGSGKSELLQTMIASLAVANRPDAMNFVLVDYKGGSAFKDCNFLPHTVGMVTDLDNHLVERALTSLSAELKYREHFLADAGVKDIEDYIALQAKDASRPSLPRLVIVIDEFASMARELPDFVTGLVNIAQRGRSLGIHLILATQRPSGVVSPEIRANTNLRISLRVTDAADSSDVLESADAARIPKSAPGRGFARLGAGALVPFQAGRVGGRRPGAANTHVPPPFVAPVVWTQLGYLSPAAVKAMAHDDVEITDLSVLVDVIRTAAEQDGVPAQRSPWLDALPERLLLSDLGAPASLRLGYGLVDIPADQQRATAIFDPARDGHLMVIGSARSGRSQLLRALAGSLARGTSTRDAHLYAIDCGNGALLPLQELPMCGAVVTRTQSERAGRLLTRLAQEMERRQQLLAAGGFADLTEQRARSEEPLPHLLLLIDRWEGFTSTLGEMDNGRLTDIVMAVLREGASVGVHAVITGDRSLMSGRMSSLTDNKLALKLADKGDYGLVGLNPRQLPDSVNPGRGFVASTGLEVQIALLDEDDSGQAQAAAISELAKTAQARDADVARQQRPFRVDVLPAAVTFEVAWDLLPAEPTGPFALAGVGGDELESLGTSFAGGRCFVVAGPARSGKSTSLTGMARSLTMTGCEVVIIAPRPSPLHQLEGQPGILRCFREAGVSAEALSSELDAAAGRPLAIVIDDAELLKDAPTADLMKEIVKGGHGDRVFVVFGGNAESICTGLSGWQVEAKKSRQGLLLSPQGISDGDLIGVRLPRSVIGQPVQPGKGLLHLGDSGLVSVVVPSA